MRLLDISIALSISLIPIACTAHTPSASASPETERSCDGPRKEAIFYGSRRRASYRTIIKKIATADYVLIGEVHTNPQHHKIQNRILSSASAKSVLFEMMEPVHDEVVSHFTKERSHTSKLQTALQWTERGWPTWDAYAPLFETARTQGMRIRHAGLDSELVRHVNNFGFLALPRKMRQKLEIKTEKPFVVDFEGLTAEVAQSHRVDQRAALRLAITQYTKDAYMADRLLSAGKKAILIAGNGHVRADIGVPGHLRKYRPGVRILTIGLIEDNSNGSDRTLQFPGPEFDRRYDFIWITSMRCGTDQPA